MRLNNVILKPIITEKSMQDGALNKYHFKVGKKASKHAIASAIESLFEVDVLNVKTLLMPGKVKGVISGGKRTGRYTKTSSWKKAIVEIQDGQKIKLVEESK